MIYFSVSLLNSSSSNISEYFIWFSSSFGVGCSDISSISVFGSYFSRDNFIG